MNEEILEEVTPTPTATPTPWIQGELPQFVAEIREDYAYIRQDIQAGIDILFMSACFCGVLAILEVMRFVKGLFKEVD